MPSNWETVRTTKFVLGWCSNASKMLTPELQPFSLVNLLDILEMLSFLTSPKKIFSQFQKVPGPRKNLGKFLQICTRERRSV